MTLHNHFDLSDWKFDRTTLGWLVRKSLGGAVLYIKKKKNIRECLKVNTAAFPEATKPLLIIKHDHHGEEINIFWIHCGWPIKKTKTKTKTKKKENKEKKSINRHPTKLFFKFLFYFFFKHSSQMGWLPAPVNCKWYYNIARCSSFYMNQIGTNILGMTSQWRHNHDRAQIANFQWNIWKKKWKLKISLKKII